MMAEHIMEQHTTNYILPSQTLTHTHTYPHDSHFPLRTARSSIEKVCDKKNAFCSTFDFSQQHFASPDDRKSGGAEWEAIERERDK